MTVYDEASGSIKSDEENDVNYADQVWYICKFILRK